MMIKHFPIALLCGFALILSVQAQDGQLGFISLDCGLPATSTYSEPGSGIDYISDEPFIDTGVSMMVAPEHRATHQQQITHLRSFPQWTRNCYRVNVTGGTKYLIRASFVYGNYDGLNRLPKFDLHLGPSFWDSITLADAAASDIKEIIHIPSLDYVHVCLVNTGSGTPFISALELRPLKNTTYIPKGGSLALGFRLDIASTSNRSYRYDDDVFDRIWLPLNLNWWGKLTTSLQIDALIHNDYQVPYAIMSTAGTPINTSDPMYVGWTAPDTTLDYYVYMHFAEVQQLKANESRSFNITLNGDHFYGPVVPDSNTITVFSPAPITGGNFTFSLFKTEGSTLPPILNAMEYYRAIDFSQSETNADDVMAITNIKSTYGVENNWQGDPCAPQDYIWEGLNCSSDDPPRITSLDLSSSGLTGEISSDISKLDMLQSLDLSNNGLTGPVPEFLTKLPNLKVLNLEKNNLNGTVPARLIEKSAIGSLSLRLGGNENLCAAISCKKKKKSLLIPIIASAGGGAILLVAAVAIFMSMKRKRKQVGTAVTESNNNQNDSFENFESKKRQFTYAEVINITNNFKTILGKGGFGTVYHGVVEDTQVAVKMLSPSSVQGYQQFQAEVKLLMRVHHRNLTGLVGYCNEGTNMALLYEYMANGNLESHLLGQDGNINVLTWESRLKIAADAAQGLEYLHNGCKPPIVHRDVKTTNILLADNFQAKLADFGLSRIFPADGGTHMSTAVAGTPGYLDPEYHITGWLNEKSDVYSFGVALLQILTGRPVITRSAQVNSHVSQWVSSMLSNGDIKSIVDPKLQGDFEVNSAWKAVEVARDCISEKSSARPNMSEVVTRLKECLGAEMARVNDRRMTGTSESSIVFTMNTGLGPSAR